MKAKENLIFANQKIKVMFLVQFNNGKFLGVDFNQKLIYADNINFAYTFQTTERAIESSKFFEKNLGETSFTITDLSGNPLVSIF